MAVRGSVRALHKNLGSKTGLASGKTLAICSRRLGLVTRRVGRAEIPREASIGAGSMGGKKQRQPRAARCRREPERSETPTKAQLLLIRIATRT